MSETSENSVLPVESVSLTANASVKPKPKRNYDPAQLAAAREKALQVKREQRELRDREKAVLQKQKEERIKKLEEAEKELQTIKAVAREKPKKATPKKKKEKTPTPSSSEYEESEEESEVEESSEEEEIVEIVKKRVPKKKVVVEKRQRAKRVTQKNASQSSRSRAIPASNHVVENGAIAHPPTPPPQPVQIDPREAYLKALYRATFGC